MLLNIADLLPTFFLFSSIVSFCLFSLLYCLVLSLLSFLLSFSSSPCFICVSFFSDLFYYLLLASLSSCLLLLSSIFFDSSTLHFAFSCFPQFFLAKVLFYLMFVNIKGCVCYIFASLFLGLNESTCQMKKNVFHFTSKPLLHFQIS